MGLQLGVGAMAVHGTSWAAWEDIQTSGLRTMGRNHVHFAVMGPGSLGSGVRRGADVLIFLNVRAALSEGLHLFVSENWVLLTRGIEGVVPPRLFLFVKEASSGSPVLPPVHGGGHSLDERRGAACTL